MMEPRMGVEEYLIPTKLCDCNHPKIRATAKEITEGAETPREASVRIFYWVRDEIKFGLYFSHTKASTILQRRIGECVNKTNVHVALLRASGIPARLRYVRCKKEVLENIISGFIYKRIDSEASHFWCECFLAGRWISCESMIDEPLYKGVLQISPTMKGRIPTIDWDGETDLVVSRAWITEDLGSLSSVDEAYKVLVLKNEGMLPPLLERLSWPIFYLSARQGDKVRRQRN